MVNIWDNWKKHELINLGSRVNGLYYAQFIIAEQPSTRTSLVCWWGMLMVNKDIRQKETVL